MLAGVMSLGSHPLVAREVADRIVASIGNQAITESDVRRQYQFELFSEGKNPDAVADPETTRRVLNQLIGQHLLLREAEGETLQAADLRSAAETRLATLREKFGSEKAFQAGLRFLNLNEQQVLTRLDAEERMLRLVDKRFRPNAWVEQSEVETYYRESFVPAYTKRSGETAPALADVEGQIREILVQKKIDQLLSNWLTETKGGHRVRIHEFSSALSGGSKDVERDE